MSNQLLVFWGVVIVVDMFRTFRSNEIHQSGNRFKIYSLTSWFIVSAVVASCFLTGSYNTIKGFKVEKFLCSQIVITLL